MHRQFAVKKMCFKEASHKVLLHIQHNEEDSIQAKRLAFSSMSRALWFNNILLAKMHLCLSGANVSIANPGFFRHYFQ